jgi:hypothetical protein
MKSESTALEIINKLLETYDAHQIEEIVLEDLEIDTISEDLKERLEEFIHLESLAFNRCQLRSLKNIPHLKKLQRFSADCNQLKVRHLVQLKQYPELVSLSLVSNELRNDGFKEFVEILQSFPNLSHLTIFDNPIVQEVNRIDKTVEL